MARRRGARGPRLHIFWSVILTVAVLAVPGAVVAWGRSTSTFTTERVVVTGARMIPKKEARRALQKSLLGENLFAVGAADVREALRRFCYLADVEIDRDFPETLRVRLVEHRPALAVLAEGRWFLVSDTGHVICEAPPKGAAAGGGAESGDSTSGAAETGPAESGDASAASATPSPAAGDGAQGATAAESGEDAAAAEASGDAAPAAGGEGGATDGAAKGGGTLEAGPAGGTENKLPRLRVAEKLEPGARADDAKVQAAVKTLAGLSGSLRRQVTLVEVTKSLRVTATLRDGLVVRFGDATRLGDKVIALRAVRGVYRRAGRTPTYIDVSVPERPLGRPLLQR